MQILLHIPIQVISYLTNYHHFGNDKHIFVLLMLFRMDKITDTFHQIYPYYFNHVMIIFFFLSILHLVSLLHTPVAVLEFDQVSVSLAAVLPVP